MSTNFYRKHRLHHHPSSIFNVAILILSTWWVADASYNQRSSSYSIDPYYNSIPFDPVSYFQPDGRGFYSSLYDNNNRINLLSNPVAPAMVSQNHRFMSKTPERDFHYATILKQQQQATIRSPFQAFQVAKDQANMRGHLLRSTLQTSDDDVYEVESAPVMKAASPYTQYHPTYSAYASAAYRTRVPMMSHWAHSSYLHEHQPMEMPMSFGFETNHHVMGHRHSAHYPTMDNHYSFAASSPYRRWPQKRYSSLQYSYPQNNHHQRLIGQLVDHPVSQESRMMNSQDMTTSIQVSAGMEPTTNPREKNLFVTLGFGDNGESSSAHGSDYMGEMSQLRQRRRHSPSSAITRHSNQWRAISSSSSSTRSLPSPSSFTSSSYTSSASEVQAQQVSPPATVTPATTTKTTNEEPKPTSGNNSMWLDMGAYSANRGSFGWYTDSPVVTPTTSSNNSKSTKKT